MEEVETVLKSKALYTSVAHTENSTSWDANFSSAQTHVKKKTQKPNKTRRVTQPPILLSFTVSRNATE